MRDTPEVIRLAEKLIAAQDMPDAEVELEVEILEINTSRLQNLGLQFPQQVSAGVGTAGAFTLNQWNNRSDSFVNLKVTDPALALNLKKIDTDTTLLANPRIRVKDREKANIHIGQRLPVMTTVSTAGVGSAETVSYIDVGLKLDVEPSIRLDDEVDMKDFRYPGLPVGYAQCGYRVETQRRRNAGAGRVDSKRRQLHGE